MRKIFGVVVVLVGLYEVCRVNNQEKKLERLAAAARMQ